MTITEVVAIVNPALLIIVSVIGNYKLESMKTEMSRRLHVHRYRYEKEFAVLEDVWAHLIELRNAVGAFTPGGKPESDPEKDKKRFEEAYFDFLRCIDTQQPFIPPEIFDLLEDYRKRQLQYIRIHDFLGQEGFHSDWVKPNFFDKRNDRLEETRKLFNQIGAAIRKRLEHG